MTKVYSTKRSLVTSVIALMLCFSMLLGTTFAWFTDSVTSANNRIQAGNLKIDLLMDKAEDGVSYSSISNQTGDIFSESTGNGINWEPGKTEVVYLAVENQGSLALKYNILLTVTDSGLANALEYAVIDGAKATDVKNVANTWNDIKVATQQVGEVADYVVAPGADAKRIAENGKLDAKVNDVTDRDYFALAVHMKEEAGNEYQNKNVVIDLVVTATQVEAEEDSFGPDYDAGLTPPVVDVELYEVTPNGTELYYLTGGEVLLYNTADYTGNASYTAPEGVTTIGNYAFAYNNTIKEVTLPSTVTSLGRGFDSSTVEKVILNEGLTTIDSRAFRATSALEEVVIPSTVTTIADNAFQKSGIKEITIPSTVATIGETAFGTSLIEKVVLEGNTSIQGYAFRGCTKLREVYLRGDDVTFIPSTLSGRNSTWFCNGESNNPNTSNITFYVENDTVKARVLAAMGAEAPNTKVYVKGVDDEWK